MPRKWGLREFEIAVLVFMVLSSVCHFVAAEEIEIEIDPEVDDVVLEDAEYPSSEEQKVPEEDGTKDNKLLVIMLDGFRWDYIEKQKEELRGFPLFLKEGVKAEWVEPVFPSESFPAWTTINTGVYPENHGILGNYMYDLKYRALFSIEDDMSTSLVHWWQNAEPLWTTATRYKKKAFLHYWSRCDVPFQEIVPFRCTSYRPAGGIKILRDTLNRAVDHLLQDYQLAMVYGEHLDNIGHDYGPYSEELRQAVRDVDEVIYDFLDRLADTGLEEKVNVIIVSDHGMSWTGEDSGTVLVSLSDYVNSSYVHKVLGYGAVMAIAPYGREVENVYHSLKGRRGFDVYKKGEIPVEFRYRNHRLVQDILVVAKEHYFLQGLQSQVQVPRIPFQEENVRAGTHGYANSTDMRTIFFAKGPDFKKGLVHPPIHLVDEYQLFAHLLKLPPQPNNGTWSKVAGMLVNKAISLQLNLCSVLLVPIVIILLGF